MLEHRLLAVLAADGHPLQLAAEGVADDVLRRGRSVSPPELHLELQLAKLDAVALSKNEVPGNVQRLARKPEDDLVQQLLGRGRTVRVLGGSDPHKTDHSKHRQPSLQMPSLLWG